MRGINNNEIEVHTSETMYTYHITQPHNSEQYNV